MKAHNDAVEWLTGKTDDGRTITVTISKAFVRTMIEKAKRNKTGRSVDGPAVVTIR